MTWLPIVERELRVRARRRGTFRVRTGAAVLAILLGAVLLLVGAGQSSRNAGSILFVTLGVLGFLFCFVEGGRHASDSLSVEKREGTMGFLFLTDLSGYDVVLGKMAAISVNLFYGLLGMLPVLGLSLLLGGVTGTQFWQTCLALVNTLFFAVSAGMMISAVSWKERNAWWGTFFFMVVVTVGVPLAGMVVILVQGAVGGGELSRWLFAPFLFLGQASPVTGFRLALSGRAMGGGFWSSFAALHLLSWVCLWIAGRRLPKVWQDRPRKGPVSMEGVARRGSGEGTWERERVAAGFRWRGALLSLNPVMWLSMRGGQAGGVAWMVVGLAGLVPVLMVVGSADWPSFLLVMLPFQLLFKMVLALEASRMFRDSRRNGSMELLLSTPLTVTEIVTGQLLALRRAFLFPLIVLMVIQVLPAIVIQFTSSETVFGGLSGLGRLTGLWGSTGYVVLSFLTGCLAVAYLGMYMALRLKRGKGAVGLTVLWAAIAPQVAFCCFPFLDVAIHIVMILLARESLMGKFRLLAMPGGVYARGIPSVETAAAPPRMGPLPEA